MNIDLCGKCHGVAHFGSCEAYYAQMAGLKPPTDYDPNDATDRKYYDAAGIKAIDVIEAYGLNFALGCVIKYVLRAGRKTADKVKDLEKAHWYLGREIERLKAAK